MKDDEYNKNIGETTSYHQYYFGYKKSYPGHDRNQQKRWKRSYEYYKRYKDGVYND